MSNQERRYKRVTAVVAKDNDNAMQKRFERETDVREKRINIVFKIIYVIAILFVSVFTTIFKSSEQGLTDSYIIGACCTSFLLCLLVRMLIYVFNELKCLKLKSEEVSDKQYRKTESSYSWIFTYITLGGVVAIFSVVAIGLLKAWLTREIVGSIMLGLIIFSGACGEPLQERYQKVCFYASSIIWTLIVICLLILVAVQ